MEVSTAKPSTPASPTNLLPVVDLLKVTGLTVEYCLGRSRLNAVDQVHLSVSVGEIVGVLGESGSGKTTTALSLLRLLPENANIISGSIVFQGKDLLEIPESELREVRGAQVSIVYQDSAVLNPVIRVGTQVAEVLRAHSGYKPGEIRERILSLFESIGLRDSQRIYDAYPHQLSGGQRQRIAIAQAMICNPSMVIADEPTASVDATTAAEILAYMEQTAERSSTAFIIISHDPDALASIADRIVVMYAGQVVEEGPTAEVFGHPLHPYTRALLECSPRRSVSKPFDKKKNRLPFIPGNAPDPSEIVTGCAFANRCSDRMPACDSHRPELLHQPPNRQVRCFKYEVA